MDAAIIAGVLATVGIVVGAIVLLLIGYVIYGAFPSTIRRRNAKYKGQRDAGKSEACIAGDHSRCSGCECSCHPKPKLSLECSTLARHERCNGTLPGTHTPCECSCHHPAVSIPSPGSPLPPPSA